MTLQVATQTNTQDTSEYSAPEHFRRHNLTVIDDGDFISHALYNAIQKDAIQQYQTSWPCQHDETSQRASPQQNRRANFGQTTYAWLDSREMAEWLYRITGQVVELSGSSSCFTYYENPGDYLSKHTDHPVQCMLTFLLYLKVEYDTQTGPGPGIYLYAGNNGNGKAQWVLRAVPRRVIIQAGSQISHWRPPLQNKEQVTMISACYRARN